MSIADKLTTIAENEQKVYDAGKQAEYDEFWDSYQQNGKRTKYSHAFAGSGWNDITYNPKYPIVAVGNADFVYAYSAVKKIGDLNLSKATGGLNQIIRQCTELEEIGEIIINDSITTLSTSFYSNHKLKTIKKLKFGTIRTFTNTFVGDSSLVNIVLEGTIAGDISFQNSSLLSKESLISIMTALKDFSSDTSGKEYVLTIGEDNKNKLTETELNIAYSKGWVIY